MEGDKEASEPTAHPEDRDDVMFSNWRRTGWKRETRSRATPTSTSPANREKPSRLRSDCRTHALRHADGLAVAHRPGDCGRGGRTVGPPGGGEAADQGGCETAGS